MSNEKTQRRATCQICEGDVAIDGGNRTSKHGYKRPGCGYTLGRCQGERNLPYELDKTILESYLNRAVLPFLADQQKRLAELQDGTITSLTVRKTTHLRGEDPNETVTSADGYRWKRALETAVWNTNQQIRAATEDKERCERRIAAWTLAPEKIREIKAADEPARWNTLGAFREGIAAEGFTITNDRAAELPAETYITMTRRGQKITAYLSGRNRFKRIAIEAQK